MSPGSNKAAARPSGPVTRADIEAKLREIRGEVDETTAKAKPFALMASVASGVAMVGAAYILGKRKGKRKATIVEIRRV